MSEPDGSVDAAIEVRDVHRPEVGGDGVADTSASPDVEQVFVDLDGGIPRPRSGPWVPPGGVEVGTVTEHPVGLWRYEPGARAIVARDARGFYAYSAVCSHEGCLLRPPDARGNTECPCHGSTFDGLGNVTAPPATVALRRFAVTLAAGRIFVDPNTRVTADVRATPPDPDAGMGGADVQRVDGALFDSGARDAAPADVDVCAEGRDVGPVSMFAPGTWTRVDSVRVIVARDARGFFAFSAICTHSGCVVDAPNPTTGTSRCACHGSEFDGEGRVTRAPAREDLDHYAVAVCAGRVRVDSGRVVPRTNRTPAG